MLDLALVGEQLLMLREDQRLQSSLIQQTKTYSPGCRRFSECSTRLTSSALSGSICLNHNFFNEIRHVDSAELW
jgi:hypothetical protein